MQIVCVVAYALRPCGGCYFSADDIRCMFKKKREILLATDLSSNVDLCLSALPRFVK